MRATDHGQGAQQSAEMATMKIRPTLTPDQEYCRKALSFWIGGDHHLPTVHAFDEVHFPWPEIERVDEPVDHSPSGVQEAVRNERELCKQDVCMYCGGRALGYSQKPTGPNEAGNWIHPSNTQQQDSVLCRASSIFARGGVE